MRELENLGSGITSLVPRVSQKDHKAEFMCYPGLWPEFNGLCTSPLNSVVRVSPRWTENARATTCCFPIQFDVLRLGFRVSKNGTRYSTSPVYFLSTVNSYRKRGRTVDSLRQLLRQRFA